MRLTDIFATTTCGRCGGSGHYSFNQVDGTVCYGCIGTGYVWDRKDKKYALDYLAARKQAKETVLRGVVAGDRINMGGDWGWVNVREAVFVPGTEQSNRGHAKTGSGPGATVHYAGSVRLTFDDGSTYEGHEREIVIRSFNLEKVLSLCKHEQTRRRVRAALEQDSSQQKED